MAVKAPSRRSDAGTRKTGLAHAAKTKKPAAPPQTPRAQRLTDNNQVQQGPIQKPTASGTNLAEGIGNWAAHGPGPEANPNAEVTPGPEANPNSEVNPNPAQNAEGPTLQGIPPRAEDALGGTEFMESIQHLPPGPERDQAIFDEVMSGNIPEDSRLLREVTVNRDGHELSFHAMPDYLSIGSNEDNVRVPMTPGVAQAIAERTGTSLPTPTMVDDIHGQSQQLHLETIGSNRDSIGAYLDNDRRTDEQLGSGAAQTDFVSGHKKDLVIPARDGRVAIYGGSWENGSQIQSYSNVHGDYYEDYSHGVRLISQDVTVDGQTMNLHDVLADPELSSLFSGFGPSANYDIPTAF